MLFATITASFEDVFYVCLRAASTSTSSSSSARLPPTTSPTSSTTAWSLAARARAFLRRRAGAGTLRAARLPGLGTLRLPGHLAALAWGASRSTGLLTDNMALALMLMVLLCLAFV